MPKEQPNKHPKVQSKAKPTVNVLIVGAGPTGLTLACLLARNSVSIRIVETSPEPQTGSRGKGLQPRTLELLDDLGIIDRIVSNGSFRLPIQFYDESGNPRQESMVGPSEPRPDQPYPGTLLTPQWRVEESLRLKLKDFGEGVEFGTELKHFAQDEDCVTAELSTPDGPSQIHAKWLVGCDGGKSAVRHLAGIEFLGETLDKIRMLVGDVHISGLDRSHWHIWSSAPSFLALCPLPLTDVFQYQAAIPPDDDGTVSLERYQALITAQTNQPNIKLLDAGWMSLWRANIRMVNRYRVGRVFLAGDAAHVHSPAGGQGMNTGMQDAFNLAWKLALVIDDADPSLLETYQEERLPIAAGVLGLSTELMQHWATRKMVFPVDERTSQLGLNYRDSKLTLDTRPDGDGLCAGDRAPEAPGLQGPAGPCRMFDLLRGPHATILGFGERWRVIIDTCKTRFGNKIKGYILTETPARADHFVDAAGHARAAYHDDTLFVVRPDNYIGLATQSENADDIISYVTKLLGESVSQSPAQSADA
jgi:2-polyprenyl-6-methoxyphenol hydroxylase-like FAD-dependent oxidoreductase